MTPQDALNDKYWTFGTLSGHHDDVFPAHDFKTRFPGTLKEHPHCTRCHVPEGCAEAGWNEGRCTERKFISFTASELAAALAAAPQPDTTAGDLQNAEMPTDPRTRGRMGNTPAPEPKEPTVVPLDADVPYSLVPVPSPQKDAPPNHDVRLMTDFQLVEVLKARAAHDANNEFGCWIGRLLTAWVTDSPLSEIDAILSERVPARIEHGLSASDLYYIMQQWEKMPASSEQTRIVIGLGKLRVDLISRGSPALITPWPAPGSPAEPPALEEWLSIVKAIANLAISSPRPYVIDYGSPLGKRIRAAASACQTAPPSAWQPDLLTSQERALMKKDRHFDPLREKLRQRVIDLRKSAERVQVYLSSPAQCSEEKTIELFALPSPPPASEPQT